MRTRLLISDPSRLRFCSVDSDDVDEEAVAKMTTIGGGPLPGRDLTPPDQMAREENADPAGDDMEKADGEDDYADDDGADITDDDGEGDDDAGDDGGDADRDGTNPFDQ